MTPFPYAAVIGAVGSIAAQALANSSASDINSQNLGQNEQNRRLTRFMYEDSKQYNSVQEQVKRLRAAGLSPAFALGGLQAGAAQGQSVPSNNPAQMPDMTGINNLGSAVANGLQYDLNAKIADAQSENLESQTKKNEQETQGIAVDNLFRRENWKSVIYNRDTQSWLNNQLADVAKLDLAFNKESFKQRLQNLKYDGELKNAQIASQNIINQYLPQLQSATYNELVARAFANYATGRSSLKSAMAAVMNAETEKGKASAQFGKNDGERSEYYKSVMLGMFQQRRHYEAQTFNLSHSKNPLPYNQLDIGNFEDWMKKYVHR